MQYREFGRTGWKVSAIGFGAWAIGGGWGAVKEEESLAALRTAIEKGVNFIDTADVYGDGQSEKLIAKVLKDFPDQRIYVATKAGRRVNPHVAEGFTRENLTAFIERSLTNLDVECLDLVQLHCPPTQVFYMPEVFGILDDLVKAGKISNYGVSVEKVEEAIKAMEYPEMKSVQIIFNMFRHRPTELFFPMAKDKKVAILARVPLASGLLSGKMKRTTKFADDDHRKFNRYGQSFDRGETFSGVDYETGLQAVEEIRTLLPEGMSMAQMALRWILNHDAVSLAIPGAKNPFQAESNAATGSMAPLDDATMQQVKAIYDKYIKELVHQRW